MPLLDYRQYRQMGNEGGVFRFTGEIESITDGHTLWVKGDDLTIPVSLEKTKCFLLPAHKGDGVPEAPEQIHWNRISTFNEGVKVFIGGQVKTRDDRLSFLSIKEKPLMVVFYNCPESKLTGEIIRAARNRNEYWNGITPVSIVIGAMALVFIAAAFLNRPAFRMTVITALVAIFVPILPMLPPGFLLTVLYRRMTWHARKFRAYLDLARLPLRYLQQGSENSVLSTGEKYGYIKYDSLPPEAGNEGFPFLVPDIKEDKKPQWHFFGVLDSSGQLSASKDPFVSFGILPSSPRILSRRYAIKAYTLEALAWLILLLGVFINIVFIYLILFLLRGISF
jgi:hypothetical protein